MVTKDFEKIIREYKKSLQNLKEIFVDSLSDDYFIETNPLNDSTTKKPINISEKDIDKTRKTAFMIITSLCGNWEGLLSDLQRKDIVAYEKVCTQTPHRQWCLEDIHQIGNIRNCIMHHNGNIKSYYSNLPMEYLENKPQTLNEWMAGESINDKFIDKRKTTLLLSKSDIVSFFSLMETDGPEYLQQNIVLS